MLQTGDKSLTQLDIPPDPQIFGGFAYGLGFFPAGDALPVIVHIHQFAVCQAGQRNNIRHHVKDPHEQCALFLGIGMGGLQPGISLLLGIKHTIQPVGQLPHFTGGV